MTADESRDAQSGVAEVLAGVLEGHVFNKALARCACGLELGGTGHRTKAWRAHVAAMQAAVIAPLLATHEQIGREDNADHGQCYVSGSQALDALLAAERAKAVEAVAREWQFGGWTILTAPPPSGAIPALALGQRVTDWLADRIEQTGTGQ